MTHDVTQDHPETPRTAAHPDTPHEFRTVCRLCGESGYLHVALITDLEVVKIEPRPSAGDKAEAPE